MSNVQNGQASGADSPRPSAGGVLNAIEWVGNKLPDPVFLFVLLAGLVMVFSAVGVAAGWSVQPIRPRVVLVAATDASGAPLLDQAGKPVMKPAQDPATGRPKIEVVPEGEPVKPRSLMSSEGLFWILNNMVRNFINFPPLGVVLVGMLGVGLAEKVGLFGAVMRILALLTPDKMLTPMIVFLGVMSSLATDAGYIVLPALAGALYAAVGRSPVVGVAAAFAGVAGGFSANLLPAAIDALLAGLTSGAAAIVQPGYTVTPLANWYFMIASTLMLTLVGWAVTAWLVEPRMRDRTAAEGGPIARGVTRTVSAWMPIVLAAVAGHVLLALLAVGLAHRVGFFGWLVERPIRLYALLSVIPHVLIVWAVFRTPSVPKGVNAEPRDPADLKLSAGEKRGLAVAGLSTMLALDVLMCAILIPGWPLHGDVNLTPTVTAPKWTQVVVPVIFFMFVTPGVAYGVATGSIRSLGDIAAGFYEAMKGVAPIIVLSFFAAQFTEFLKYTNLDRMLAFAGGEALLASGLPPTVMLVGLVVISLLINLLIASMSAKWAMLAPVIVPMLMIVGISPELAQVTYRVGDSVTNIVTPLNSYLLIVLVVMQRYWSRAGMGTLIATMTPYSVVFAVAWTLMLLAWVWLGWPLGPGAGLWYAPH